jgi:methionyl-tRNA formyltransferase
MTDVPYGRGGAPLQNLISRGHRTTKISALRMIEELDAGPVYLKRPLDLSGSAQDIYERAANVVFDLIAEIVATEPAPVAQAGPPTLFRRRRPEQSRLPETADLHALYDHIRMLDADGYPRAFLDVGPLRLEFRRAALNDDSLAAEVVVRVIGRGR